MTDWNWFFSSFCQSAAALIGIIAAFLISRLIGLNEKVNAILSVFEELMIERDKLIHSFGQRRFRWYNSTLMRCSEALRDEIKRGAFHDLSDIDILEKIYSEDDRLFKANDVVLKTFRELQEKYQRNGFTEEAVPHEVQDHLQRERMFIDHLETDTRKLIQLFRKNEQELRVFRETFKPVSNIIIVLIIAFPITVIYPLHFMPVQVGHTPAEAMSLPAMWSTLTSLKGFLLTAFFITIEGIFVYFLTLNDKMRKDIGKGIARHSPDYQKMHYYSPYLEL
ncbi:MAG TPA: hypothetical protein VM802_03960 [Chitinophaga sp.]|uniref:hypothetical protein n=1 Tax=Chitinophaga sp. TaxID=1869181 RepID=UPI002C58EA93|nr:hypothetical protein [Chitinophaga sp.]HVI43991.1 hypothetical protein [Chitinophaga sp.]